MFGLFDWLKLGAGAIVGAVLGYLAGHWQGDSDGYARAQAENVQAAFDQVKERMETDAEVHDMPDADLCELLGGVFEDGQCR